MECATSVRLSVPAVLAFLRQLVVELRRGDEDLGRFLEDPTKRPSSARSASTN